MLNPTIYNVLLVALVVILATIVYAVLKGILQNTHKKKVTSSPIYLDSQSLPPDSYASFGIDKIMGETIIPSFYHKSITTQTTIPSESKEIEVVLD